MKYRRLDANHDYSFGRGIDDFLEDVAGNPEAIAQAIKTRLLLFTGEWWEDLRDGLPLWQKILGNRVRDRSIVDRLIVSRIQGLQTPDNIYAVTAVNNVSSEFDADLREYSFMCDVDTVFGKLYVTNRDQGNVI